MDGDPATLLAAAARGDQGAWNALVEEFTGLLWSIARGYRLGPEDAGDAVQLTWLRLVENLERIDDPRRLPGWLSTTMRRECLQVLRRKGRERPSVVAETMLDLADAGPPVDAALIEDERDRALWKALGAISERCRTLLRVLMASPPPAYVDVAAALGMAVGSIGPTRQRCMTELRRRVEADDLLHAP